MAMTTITGAPMANGGERLPSYSQTRRYCSEEFVDVKAPLWYHNEPRREDILYELERVLEVCHSFLFFIFLMNRRRWVRSGDLIFQAA